MPNTPRRKTWDKVEQLTYSLTNDIVKNTGQSRVLFSPISQSDLAKWTEKMETTIHDILAEVGMASSFAENKGFEFTPEYDAAVTILGHVEAIREHAIGNTHPNMGFIMGELHACRKSLGPLFRLFNE